MASKLGNWFGGFFSSPKEEAPKSKEETERTLVINTFRQIRDKLIFIQKDFESFIQEPELSGALKSIENLIGALQKTRDAYTSDDDAEKIDIIELKKQWGNAINQHMEAIEKNIDTTDVIYHRVHQAIQAFLKWAQNALYQLGVLSQPYKKDPNRKPWIKEKENTAGNRDDIIGFEDDLDDSRESEKHNP